MNKKNKTKQNKQNKTNKTKQNLPYAFPHLFSYKHELDLLLLVGFHAIVHVNVYYN